MLETPTLNKLAAFADSLALFDSPASVSVDPQLAKVTTKIIVGIPNAVFIRSV
jgi:hypothetical protein